ncbi:IclR family transcriptional regulator [Paenibacillus sp. GCM10027626]|uniref:IclR family transcriptional regulator n=1 Tax=Paenibacillus sp. GCM10027626 TaxID=3273411 RepID=UPI003645EF4E
MSKPDARVKSADRVMDILELFSPTDEKYNLTEIAKLLDMPPSSTHLLLQNMLARGYLETDESGKYFRLGYKIFEISNMFTKSTTLLSEFERVGSHAAAEMNESVMLGIRTGDQLLYIAQKNPPDPRRFSIQFTQSLPLYASASGKIILSGLSDSAIRKLYPHDNLQALTNRTITTVSSLLDELRTIRSEAISFNFGESIEGISCISAPVYNISGVIIAAISVSIPDFRVTEQSWQHSIACIQESARLLSYKPLSLPLSSS